jgi:hypothetical protein
MSFLAMARPSANVSWMPDVVMMLPTAVQPPAVQATPLRTLSSALKGLGVLWTDHEVPFQASARVSTTPELSVKEPTAVQALAEVHDTPERALPVTPSEGLGVVLMDQEVPLEFSASANSLPPLPT